MLQKYKMWHSFLTIKLYRHIQHTISWDSLLNSLYNITILSIHVCAVSQCCIDICANIIKLYARLSQRCNMMLYPCLCNIILFYPCLFISIMALYSYLCQHHDIVAMSKATSWHYLHVCQHLDISVCATSWCCFHVFDVILYPWHCQMMLDSFYGKSWCYIPVVSNMMM